MAVPMGQRRPFNLDPFGRILGLRSTLRLMPLPPWVLDRLRCSDRVSARSISFLQIFELPFTFRDLGIQLLR